MLQVLFETVSVTFIIISSVAATKQNLWIREEQKLLVILSLNLKKLEWQFLAEIQLPMNKTFVASLYLT